jgi:hypothetical protein
MSLGGLPLGKSAVPVSGEKYVGLRTGHSSNNQILFPIFVEITRNDSASANCTYLKSG